MKRLISLLLALMMLFSLAACSGDGLSSLIPGSQASSPGSSEDPDNDAKETDADSKNGGEDDYIVPNEDGIAMGYEGDTLRTAFFDMKIENPQTCDEFDGLVPEDGFKFLTVDLTLYNYTDYTCPMYDTDFEVIWDLDDDNAWAWPECEETVDENGEPEYFVRSDKQLPIEYNLGIHKSQTGVLLYQVPVDTCDYYIAFYEVFDDGTDEGNWGDAFYVLFSE